MKLPKYAIENHQFTIVAVALLVLTGIVSFFTMPRSEDPQVSPAGTSVIVVFPGANPVDLEELVVDPIEEVINELEDIKEIKTTAEDGLAVIAVEFLSGSDPDDKYSDVVQKVNSVRNELPTEVARLELVKWSISDVNILQVGIVSEKASYRELEKEADRLEKKFERVSGIKKIRTWAFPEQELRISLDLERIAQLNIPLNQVIGMIQSNNANIPGGHIDLNTKRYNVKTSGSYSSLEEIKNTIIDAKSGNIIYLRDIADVHLDYEEKQYLGRVNGKRAVFVTANQKEGTNIYNVANGLKKELSEFESTLPESMKIEVVFDQTNSVSYRLNNFFSNMLQGLILVGIVVLLAVGFRASVIVMLAIPFSIFIGIGALDFSNYGLQQMSIVGLVIALGLLVDNAIVVTENITRYMRMGYSAFESAVKGTSQIAWAVVSSTVTTLLAFVPIIMMKNITGDFIRSMPLTVVFTLTASLLISLTLTPYLSSKFIKIKAEDNGKESWFRRTLNKFVATKYRKTLNSALSRPKTVAAIAVLVFFACLTLFPIVGVSFFPKAEKEIFIINVQTPEGTSLDFTDKVVRDIEKSLVENENVNLYATNVGHGNPRIYYNMFQQYEKQNYAMLFVELSTRDLDVFNNVINDLRTEFDNYAGTKIEVKEFEQGPPVDAPIEIRIIGENLDELKKISKDVEEMFESTEGTVNINNPLSTSKTDLRVNINRAKAGMLGVQIAEIDKTVRAAVAGLNISNYRDKEGKEYNIVLRLPVKKKTVLEDFDKVYVSSVTGAQVPLKQVATLRFESSPMKINHYNLERNVTITSDVISGFSVDASTTEILEKLEAYDWPRGYNYYAAGELESREESFGGMLQAIIIAMVGIFGVLVLQFKSYSQPLIVFSAIPLAIVGSILALLLTGYSFSFTAFVGITSLVGIVVNNSILLVDYTNQLRREGKELLEAIKIAGETRFIPIVLTTATTVGGLLPLTLGGGTLWAPMGWTIIGGLLVSTVLTLVVVPVLYRIYTLKNLS